MKRQKKCSSFFFVAPKKNEDILNKNTRDLQSVLATGLGRNRYAFRPSLILLHEDYSLEACALRAAA